MAGLINMSARNFCRKLLNSKPNGAVVRLNAAPKQLISTSEKKKDGAAVTTNAETMPKDIPDFTKPYSQNWVSYGFDRESEKDDLNAMHSIFFFSITIAIVFGTFFFAYFPDFKHRDWSHREAFLELRRREAAGLPLVDKNYVDPAKIKLPSDEELGDREIII